MSLESLRNLPMKEFSLAVVKDAEECTKHLDELQDRYMGKMNSCGACCPSKDDEIRFPHFHLWLTNEECPKVPVICSEACALKWLNKHGVYYQ